MSLDTEFQACVVETLSEKKDWMLFMRLYDDVSARWARLHPVGIGKLFKDAAEALEKQWPKPEGHARPLKIFLENMAGIFGKIAPVKLHYALNGLTDVGDVEERIENRPGTTRQSFYYKISGTHWTQRV